MTHALFEVRAGAFIFNKNNELLLMQNTCGTWGIVGGHLEKGERSIEEALHREVFEEARIKIKIISPLPTKVVGVSFIVPFVALYSSGSVRISHEHLDFAWVKLSKLKKYKLTFPTLPIEAKIALKMLKKVHK